MSAMKKLILLGIGLFVLGAPVEFTGLAFQKPGYIAEQTFVDGVLVVRLRDLSRGMEVSVLPSIGNMASEMKVYGKNILFFPETKLSDFQKRPTQCGIPLLAPWANRIDGTAFRANGKDYHFNLTLGNISRDGNGLPMHGLLSKAVWEVTDLRADAGSAQVTSRFDFWKHPDLMAQWPFAHQYEMTYRLAEGALEVKTTVKNLSAESMPVVLGFHPYYRIPGIPRDNWSLRMPAAKAVVADSRRIPTGEFKPNDLPNPLPLLGRALDDGFTDLERDEKNRASFSIEAGEKKIELLFGPKYTVAVIWEPASPPGRPLDFICIEPMAGITNATNFKGAFFLQSVPPNGQWTESFWIRPQGID